MRSASLGCRTSPVGAEHRHPAEAELHELQRHQPVVHAAELDAAELDHVDLDAAGGQPVEEALDELVRLVVQEEGAVEQVHADDAERLLLRDASTSSIRTCMTIWLGSSCGWAWNLTPIQPWHSLPPREAAGDHGVGEGEEATWCRRARRSSRSMLSWNSWSSMRLQPARRDVAVDLAVDGVADRHVVGGDATWRWCPAAPPTRKNQRTTSWPAPISANVPYQRGSRLIRSAFWCVSDSCPPPMSSVIRPPAAHPA